MTRRNLPLGAVLAAALLVPATASAGGFVLYEFGAGATGRCGAQTAQAEDASILFFNPAAMTRLPGTQISLGDTLVRPYSRYHAEGTVRQVLPGIRFGAAGTPRDVEVSDGTHSTDQEPLIFFPPHFYVTHRFGESVGVGFAFHTPYGLAVDYPRDWDGRYVIKKVSLQTLVFNPNVAVDLVPLLGLGAGGEKGLHLSLSAGYMLVYGMALLDRNIDLRSLAGFSQPPFPDTEVGWDGQVRMEGDGWAQSWNASLHFELPQVFSLGAQYRHGFTLDFEGDAKFKIPSGLVEPLHTLGQDFPDTTGQTSMNMPGLYNVGVALLAVPNLVLEADLFLEDWTSYEQLTLKWACVREKTCNIPEAPMRKDWEWNYQLSFGAQYTLASDLTLRLGYGRVGTPVPEDTYDPLLPDGERNLFTAGFGFPFLGRYRFDLGYMLARWEGTKTGRTRVVDGKTVFVNDIGGPEGTALNGRAIGTYTNTTHLLGVTLGAKL